MNNIHWILILFVLSRFPFIVVKPLESFLEPSAVFSYFTKMITLCIPALYLSLCLWPRYFYSIRGEVHKNNFWVDSYKILFISILFHSVMFLLTTPSVYIALNSYKIIVGDEALKHYPVWHRVVVSLYVTILDILTVLMYPIIVSGRCHHEREHYILDNWFLGHYKFIKSNLPQVLQLILLIIGVKIILTATLYLTGQYDIVKSNLYLQNAISFPFALVFSYINIYKFYLLHTLEFSPFHQKLPVGSAH